MNQPNAPRAMIRTTTAAAGPETIRAMRSARSMRGVSILRVYHRIVDRANYADPQLAALVAWAGLALAASGQGEPSSIRHDGNNSSISDA